MEKIAVYCPTKEIALKVTEKAGFNWNESSIDMMFENYGKEMPCVSLCDKTYCPKKWYIREGHKIITAEEYLGIKEGGEIKVGSTVGSTVENVSDSDINIPIGWKSTITRVDRYSVYITDADGDSRCRPIECYKTIQNQNQKGETKMTININNEVAKIYTSIEDGRVVTKYFGSYFTPLTVLTLSKEDTGRILKEAKRLQTEEDDKE